MKQKIIAAGGLVTNENKELLMIFRRKKWDLPKGKLDDGETIADCAVREVKEETGITDLKQGPFIGTTLHEYADNHIKKNVIKETHWYKMYAKKNAKLIPQEEEDIEKIIWADKKKIKECLKNSYRNIAEIIELFQKKEV